MSVIKLSNTYNTRSLSYLVNIDNKRIKDNLIIRSDNLSLLNLNDINILKNKYNLKNIIDLRTKKEISNEPDVKIDGVGYVINSILEDDKIGITKEDNPYTFEEFIHKLYDEGIASSIIFMEETYKSLVTSQHSLNAYNNFITLLLKNDGVTLYHCSAGKDRAGFATIILLYLLDFDMKDIIEDYLFTNICYKNKINEESKKFGHKYKDVLECVYGVKKDYLDLLFKHIELNYQNFDDFIKNALKINDDVKNRLKDKYLE